ncbi:MAG: DUF2779 domain-containing protein, partial [Actinomycetota bacterium]|nr:DUF2779 domain-containing protein [Actinomycetota bacterium]
ILERRQAGFRITEVKSTTEAKDEHLPDVAIQTWVARGTGLPVVESHLMHLNKACRAPDLSNLFARGDRTAEVVLEFATIPGQVTSMIRVLEEPAPPDVPIGPHCDEPYECPFKGRCWPVLPPHHFTTLARLSAKKRTQLEALGVVTIDQIPADFELTDNQERQRRAVVTGKPVIDPALGAALKSYEGERVAFLDFETVRPAIPIWDGTGPYAQVPAQFSVHMADGRRGAGAQELTHCEWIATGPEDPRPGIAQAVVEACRGADVVVAFNATFERACLEMLAGAVPALAPELEQIRLRIKDLADPVRRSFYHPDFQGSYSLKKVVPALIPELAYNDLEVADGTTASNRLLSLMLNEPAMDEEIRQRFRQELLDYCGRDTLVMVKLLEKLKKLAV